MGRTTWNIDDDVLREVKALAEQEGKSAGDKATELLASALGQIRDEGAAPRTFRWVTQNMGFKIDIDDKDALYRVLDER